MSNCSVSKLIWYCYLRTITKGRRLLMLIIMCNTVLVTLCIHLTKTAFQISLIDIKCYWKLTYISYFDNSLIIHGIIYQIVFEHLDLYVLLYNTIKCDMKTEEKVVNNFIDENIFPRMVSSLGPDGWYLGIYVKTYIPYTKSFNISVSIGLITLAHVLDGYEICLNTTNYPIFNM